MVDSKLAMPEAFISYRHADPDQGLAAALHDFLRVNVVTSFLDRDIPLGSRWDEVIGAQLDQAPCLILLVSQRSIQSDAVREEVRRFHAAKKRILPIRIGEVPDLPYHLALMLNPVQYTRWDPDSSYDTLFPAILAALRGEDLPELGIALEQGVPLPEADLRMEAGTVPLDSRYYLRRKADDEIEQALQIPGGHTVAIRGVRQSGKSSLLLRAHAYAQSLGHTSWLYTFEQAQSGHLETLDALLRHLARRIERDLGVSLRASDVWEEDDALFSFETFVRRAVLEPSPGPVLFCLDEVDRIFESPFRDDFFGMIRVWHNNRALGGVWRKLSTIVTHATEPAYWIAQVFRSPFNVAQPQLRLVDWSAKEIEQEAVLYAQAVDAEALRDFFGGHPYMVRLALYTLKKEQLTLDRLQAMATASESPFAEHVRGRLARSALGPESVKALRQVANGRQCETEEAFQRLLLTGLVEGNTRRDVRLRCRLYEIYLREHL